MSLSQSSHHTGESSEFKPHVSKEFDGETTWKQLQFGRSALISGGAFFASHKS